MGDMHQQLHGNLVLACALGLLPKGINSIKINHEHSLFEGLRYLYFIRHLLSPDPKEPDSLYERCRM